MPEKTVVLEKYEIQPDRAETERQYAHLPPYAGSDLGVRMFLHHLPALPEEARAFLQELGIDPKKIILARPLAAPDENGEVLFFAAARFCGTILRGEETRPRRSVEAHGLSLVFLSDPAEMSPALPCLSENDAEVRFVVPLPFDAGFFE